MLTFYFDFISPFGYLASLRIDEMAARYGQQCRWQSMLLGISVLKVMGMKPLPQTPLKGPYLQADLARYLRRHGLTLARPPGTRPANPIPAGRTFHWLDQEDPATAKTVARSLLHAYWIDNRDIGDPHIVADIAAMHGVDPLRLRAALTNGEGDRLLREAIDRSLQAGVFGSPFFLADDEPFFGLEKMELLEEWLETGGW